MKIDLEWRIPWPADWEREKKVRAAEKLASYANDGTIFESKNRMLGKAEVAYTSGNHDDDPFLRIRLES